MEDCSITPVYKLDGFPGSVQTLDDIAERFTKMQKFIYDIIKEDIVDEEHTDSRGRTYGLNPEEYAKLADAAREACDAIEYHSVRRCQVHHSSAHAALGLAGQYSVYWGDNLIANVDTSAEAWEHARMHEHSVMPHEAGNRDGWE